MDFQTAALTGATGHLGNVLVRELLRRGKRVRALEEPGDEARALSGLAVEVVPGDVLRPETLAAAFAGADVVFHLAGAASSPRLPATIRRSPPATTGRPRPGPPGSSSTP
jgi:uncharacterized protein YbjT (DUF2867 family)